MKVNRKLFIIAAAAFVAAFMMGCSSDAGEDTAYNEPPTQTTPVPIETPSHTATPEPTAEPEPVLWEYEFQRVVLQDGSAEMLVNNTWQAVDESGAAPIVVDGVLWIPLATAQLAAGEDVSWTIDGDGFTVALGELDVTGIGERIDGVLFVPLQEIAQVINLRTLGWEEASGTLVVSTGEAVVMSPVLYANINAQAEVWYGSPNSIVIATNLMALQRHNGGWPEGTGQGGSAPHSPANIAGITAEQRAQAQMLRSNNDAYFGRGITTNETRFMLRMYQATRIEAFGESAMLGLGAILDNQLDNGGWSYFVSGRTDYRGSVISFKDQAIPHIMRLLGDIKDGAFSCVIDDELLQRVIYAYNAGMQAILNLQIWYSIEHEGQRIAAWASNSHPVTMWPNWSRQFEPPAIGGRETVEVLNFLMSRENPSQEIKDAIHAGVAFIAYVEIFGYRQADASSPFGNNRTLVPTEGARGVWARFYCVETLNPLFYDRRTPTWRDGENQDRPGVLSSNPAGGTLRNIYNEDGTMDISGSFANLSHERRNGYQYMGNWGGAVPNNYAQWRARNGL